MKEYERAQRGWGHGAGVDSRELQEQEERMEAAMEVVCFWRSEKERVEWVARPIHDEVFAKVMEAAASASHTLQTVERSWGILS